MIKLEGKKLEEIRSVVWGVATAALHCWMEDFTEAAQSVLRRASAAQAAGL